jgi:ribonuclease BN (tRNA processing enzyme)
MCSSCEAVYYPGIRKLAERLAAEPAGADALYKSITGNALSVEQAGEVASAAGVKMLVLNHFGPGDDSVPESVFVDAARTTYAGEIIAGRDLLEI